MRQNSLSLDEPQLTRDAIKTPEQFLSDTVKADCGNTKLLFLMADIIIFVEHHQFLPSFFFFFLLGTDPWYCDGQLVNSQSLKPEKTSQQWNGPIICQCSLSGWEKQCWPANNSLGFDRLCLLSWAPFWYPKQGLVIKLQPSYQHGISDNKQWVNSLINDKAPGIQCLWISQARGSQLGSLWNNLKGQKRKIRNNKNKWKKWSLILLICVFWLDTCVYLQIQHNIRWRTNHSSQMCATN